MKQAFVLTLVLNLFAVLPASAMSIDWTGTYRFEWVQVSRPSLAYPSAKAYGLNYLGLSPRIIATDGVTIGAKFDVLASQDTAYNTAQTGEVWGLRSGATDKNVKSDAKPTMPMGVRELYMTANQEYGSLIVGRAPYEFGLGLVWNAGNGPFDHWGTNSDLVAYKFFVGNLQFMPMIGRVAVPAPGFQQFDTVQDTTLQISYDSEESGSSIGAVINRRQSSTTSNDIATTGVTSGYSVQTTSFMLGRTWESFKFKMEAAFTDGELGITDISGAKPKAKGYGIALDLEFPRPQGKWEFSSKIGMASGDNPTTPDNEGFAFHRNYDVAMLMFSHRLGQVDLLGTSGMRETVTHTVANSLDDEAISNATFLAPKLRYRFSDRWQLDNTLVYAQLMNNWASTGTDLKKDLGTEWDIALHYRPRTNWIWTNEVGLLFPGAAFKDGSNNLTNGFTYGFSTKTAITF